MLYKFMVSFIFLFSSVTVAKRVRNDKWYKWLLLIPPIVFIFLFSFDLLNINIHVGEFTWNLGIVLPMMICEAIYFVYLAFVSKQTPNGYDFIVFGAIVLVDIIIKMFYGAFTMNDFNYYNDPANSYGLVLFALSYGFVEYATLYALDLKSWTRETWTTKVIIVVFGYFFSFALIVAQHAIDSIKDGNSSDLSSALFVLLYLVIITIILFAVYEMNKYFRKENIRRQDEAKQINEYYNKQVLLNQEELIKIRHDLNNVLEVIKLKDETIFNELKEKIDRYNAVYYCEDDLLNKILVLKASEAKKAGITIEVTARLDEEIPLVELEKISLFSNLLDNAITAASKSEDKTIKIGISYANKELDIDIVNSCDKLIKKSNIKYHGKGKDIINDIISKYDGTMIVYYANKRYSVDVKIDLQEASKNFESAKNYI